MKISFILLSTLIIFGLFSNCSTKENKYLNEIATIEQFCKLTDNLTRGLEASTKRVGVGKVIVDFIREYKRLKPDMGKLESRYPELKITGGEKTAPNELKPYFKKAANSLARLRAVLDGKAARFGGDQDLMKIMRELKEVLYYY
jgi:hypothetical protein